MLRAHLPTEIANHRCVLGDSFLVVKTFFVRDTKIVHCANCEYTLLEVLQLDHILRVLRAELFFDKSELLSSFVCHEDVSLIYCKATEAHRAGNPNQVSQLFERPHF